MKAKHALAVAAVLSMGIAAPAAAQTVDAIVAKLRATGTLSMGYRETLLPTSYLDENKKPTGKLGIIRQDDDFGNQVELAFRRAET